MSYLHSLAVFFSVVEYKSFSAAAKQLKLTQPTISFHIDNLEKKFGCPLFVRTAKGVTLTIYGQTLFENTYGIHDIINTTENQLKAMVAGSYGQVLIGASTIPGEYILPNIVSQFLLENPGLKISLKAGNSSEILAAYYRGEFPIAIIGLKPDIDSVPLWRDELVLAAHPDIGSDLTQSLKLDDLASYSFILREASSGTRSVMLEALARNGVAPEKLNIVLQVGSNEALKAALLHKVGIGFISRWAIKRELAEGRLIQICLKDFNIERQFYAVHRKPMLPACIDRFWTFLTTSTIN
ncbi:HTH-type transcriptional regulator CysL [bioreactor metagenome]|uniref:HTH-type transcriptional regulator CysL n=1 Tax=bioreactor metagenome TaxID=1076179 RepID=A0A644ZP83_9ZZZZ